MKNRIRTEPWAVGARTKPKSKTADCRAGCPHWRIAGMWKTKCQVRNGQLLMHHATVHVSPFDESSFLNPNWPTTITFYGWDMESPRKKSPLLNLQRCKPFTTLNFLRLGSNWKHSLVCWINTEMYHRDVWRQRSQILKPSNALAASQETMQMDSWVPRSLWRDEKGC